jgi:hypothetical protein
MAGAVYFCFGVLLGSALGREPLRQRIVEAENTTSALDYLLKDHKCFLAVEVEDSLRSSVGAWNLLQADWPHEEIRMGLEEGDCSEEPFEWPEMEWEDDVEEVD